MKNNNTKGFTLLELLIVVVIISILALAVLFVLNPAETLRKTRDAQRFADLAATKHVIAIYLTTITTPYLGASDSNDKCKAGSGGGTYASGDKIFYSVHDDDTLITDTSLDGSTFVSIPAAQQATSSATNQLVDGSGWIPIALSAISGGSPISNLPIDPVNMISDGSVISNSNLIYRYACNETDMTFEINTVLESTAFTSDDNKMTKDGGNNDSYYEIGTNLKILGTGTDF